MIDQLIILDTKLFLLLNGLHNSFFDMVMYWISAKQTWYLLYIVVLFFVFRQYKLKGLITLLFLVLLVVCADQGSVQLFKNVFERPRPCHNIDIAHLVHTVRGHCGGQYGFISSHASNTFAFATFVSMLFARKWLTISIFVWASIVTYSRIYLGVHYPADVLCGAIFGIIVGLSVYKFYDLSTNRINKKYIFDKQKSKT